MKENKNPKVEEFMARLEHPHKDVVSKARAEILKSNSNITESIKWNAPNFLYKGEDRVTFRLNPSPTLQVIFHRGAKVKDGSGFKFEDEMQVLKWASSDRGIYEFNTSGDVDGQIADLVTLVNRWMKATEVKQ